MKTTDWHAYNDVLEKLTFPDIEIEADEVPILVEVRSRVVFAYASSYICLVLIDMSWNPRLREVCERLKLKIETSLEERQTFIQWMTEKNTADLHYLVPDKVLRLYWLDQMIEQGKAKQKENES